MIGSCLGLAAPSVSRFFLCRGEGAATRRLLEKLRRGSLETKVRTIGSLYKDDNDDGGENFCEKVIHTVSKFIALDSMSFNLPDIWVNFSGVEFLKNCIQGFKKKVRKSFTCVRVVNKT